MKTSSERSRILPGRRVRNSARNGSLAWLSLFVIGACGAGACSATRNTPNDSSGAENNTPNDSSGTENNTPSGGAGGTMAAGGSATSTPETDTSATSGEGGGQSTTVDAAPPGSSQNPAPAECGEWACWPMPNPTAAALPNPASYDSSNPDVVLDAVTGLMWQRVAPLEELSSADIASACVDLDLAGHTDWRLPKLIELISLVDHASDAPGGTVKTIAEFADAGPFFFWSATLAAGSATGAWRASLSNGGVDLPSSFARARIRCVRTHAVRATAADHYTTQGTAPNNTVQDNWTGLVWQANATGLEHSFAEAQSYCSGLSLEGGGWRTPSARELQTLVDRSKSENLMIDESVFANAQRFNWTSSPDALMNTNAWFLDLVLGTVNNFMVTGGNLIDQKFSVRCVR